MKKFKLFSNNILLLIFLLTGINMLLSQVPEWVEELPQLYDQLQGVGFANDTDNPEEDQQNADTQAMNQIIHEISTSISHEVNSYYQEVNTTTGNVAKEQLESFSKQYAKATIKGIKIIKRYHDKENKIYYSYAILSKAELDKQFKESAENVVKICRDYHNYAKKAIARKDITTAINNYSKALNQIFIVQANIKNQIETDFDQNGKKEMLQIRIENEIAQILNKLQFSVINGSNQKAERNRNLSRPLIGKVIYDDGENSCEVKDLPVKLHFANAKGKLSTSIVTGSNGIFTGYVNNIESAESETGIIRATVDFADLESFRSEIPTLFRSLEKTNCEFKFKIDVASSIKIFVYIMEEIEGEFQKKRLTDRKLIKQLIQNKYSVIDSRRLPSGVSIQDIEFAIEYDDNNSISEKLKEVVDYAIIGLVRSEEWEVSSGILYFSKAGSDVKVIDLKSNRIIASSSQSLVKGAGNNFPNAHKEALEKCSELVVEDIISGLSEMLK